MYTTVYPVAKGLKSMGLVPESAAFEEAAGLEFELLDCQTQYLGSDHPETLATLRH
jgi:hypothetical protein